ncbi:Alpha/Beta hydrolase protein [Bombardia bombarda]|uniref:Alpha/Beta hydrolase protein n=1 Tax=Bombardia bombarda TaxID=252184 RepID=A0AA39WZK5_9PEZI|nr:Alpha/Beta hydrolase protein [Bombardia bombarda]
MADFGKVPGTATLDVVPFKAQVEEQKLQDLKLLLKLSPISPPTFESSGLVNRRYGVPRDWLVNAKAYWLDKFDWRKHEDYINSFPQFTARVKDFNDAKIELDIHFVALFSQKKDAIPLVLYHGWPGSFLEFLAILDLLRTKYTPDTLPYHVIVPSLPGYTYSGGPPIDSDFCVQDASLALDKLITGLGFKGYLAQGGDIGSRVARFQAAGCDACKGMHINFQSMNPPPNADDLPILDIEKQSLSRGSSFREVGRAYAIQHGTKTATIGHVLSSSPLALLSWISEKFLDWSDEDPELDAILASVTLYWLTETFARCIYPYRDIAGSKERPRISSVIGVPHPPPYVSKPSGYSFFPKELLPTPISWVGTTCNLVSSASHTAGGHFAAMEKPAELLADVEEFVTKVTLQPGFSLTDFY